MTHIIEWDVIITWDSELNSASFSLFYNVSELYSAVVHISSLFAILWEFVLCSSPCGYVVSVHRSCITPPCCVLSFTLLASLRYISRTPGWTRSSADIFVKLTKHKVIVGSGAHGIEHVGFVWDQQLFVIRKHLCETKILAVHLLQVVFLQSSLNHLSCLVLTGYQNTFINVSDVAKFHADSDNTSIGNLLVVHWMKGSMQLERRRGWRRWWRCCRWRRGGAVRQICL